eukprot:evm.model.scf_1445.1 EVM.evm.TU.scf_1445.1   scf_1445:1000-5471(-)
MDPSVAHSRAPGTVMTMANSQLQSADPLVQSLLSDHAFVAAVQGQQMRTAAIAAVTVFRAQMAHLPFSSPGMTCPSLAAAGARLPQLKTREDPDGVLCRQISRQASSKSRDREQSIVGERMIVRSGNKRGGSSMANIEVVVLALEMGGWAHCRRCDTGAVVKLPQKWLAPLAGGMTGTPRKGSNRKRSLDQMGSPFAAQDVQALTSEDPNRDVHDALHRIRKEILDLEEYIPWNAVSRNWKNRRATWRKSVRASEAVTDLATRLRDLLGALLWDRTWKTAHGGRIWEHETEECCRGHAEVDQLANLWDNIVREVRRWIQERDVPPQPITANVSPDQTARLAMAGLEEAVLKGEEGLRQVPLDAITNCSIRSLKTVKEYYLEEARSLKAALEKLQNKAVHGGPNVEGADDGHQLLAEMELGKKRPRLEDEVFGQCDDTSSETELSDC